jgi:uncharacterized membrane protein YbhN (UPF0104 family)
VERRPNPASGRLAGTVARQAWKAALVVAIVALGLMTATKHVAGVSWSDVVGVLAQVSPGRLALLTAVWFGGLVVYSVVLASALPGLGMPRGLLLNLSGSAVSNVVPLGGAVGTALNWRMVTRWGHSNADFVAYCLLTNLLDVGTKLVLPLVAVVGLVLVDGHVPRTLWMVAAACALTLLVSAAVVRVLGPLRPRTSGRLAGAADKVRGSLTGISRLFRDGWQRQVIGSAVYIAAQVLLLDLSLRTVGLQPALVVVVMAAALERLGTLVPLTPGGTGIAELGAIAWLVASGLAPVQVVAGVVLCRIFLVVLEIPVGGALLAGWAWRQRPRVSGAVG